MTVNNIKIKEAFDFNVLKWDTEFFGVKSGKAVLNKELTTTEWNELLSKCKNYQFISIVNLFSEPKNAQTIGLNTSAFLADTNIQFEKKVNGPKNIPGNVTIHQSLPRDERILEMANFEYSKFIEDEKLAKRGGSQVYYEWISNSFNNPEKYFALYRSENNYLNGFVLFSFNQNECVIELIAVSNTNKSKGIGTALFSTVEFEAERRGINVIQVGTQIRNLEAINFYHKVGCQQIGCHQVYHLWKEKS
ncbi:GNAT family N-acetyltransferase [Mesobacillus subterraneus]|uniref:GNAT family N-acetyltransferase n=1 Tax=Mesobacillus subterraneus TaxID=285983 RepID=UPI001CFCDA13|nr:GNAT family N-acetyltransferase [Mesobacillus subterraneus]WLR55464.1 GNAT family N-acetyltransferase [Mesobacillus subterraneus]